MPARWTGRLSESRRGYSARHHAQHAEPLPVSSPVSHNGPSLYDIVLRQAITTQHGLTTSERLELRACEGCGKRYLLASVWQPISEEGAIACLRCGAEAITWDGARGYLAYWHREGEFPKRPVAARADWTVRNSR